MRKGLPAFQDAAPASGLGFANALYTRSLRISINPALTLFFFRELKAADPTTRQMTGELKPAGIHRPDADADGVAV
jgi:hypothetical protein